MSLCSSPRPVESQTLVAMFTLVAAMMACPAALAQHATIGTPATPLKSIDAIDHTDWNDLLQRFVNERGMVNYAAWKADAAAMQQLDSYLDDLASADPNQSAGRNAKLAFWINAYNAVTVRGILREYPTKSIKNHVSRFGGYSIWKHFKLNVGGTPYSLDDMEHEVLRKMSEPRIHMAVVCASISCPRLLNRAYLAETLEAQLAENTRDFFANPGNFRYDAKKGRMYVSSILKWYGTDFAATPQAQLSKLAEYLPTADARAAAKGRFRVSYLSYDWGLNKQ